MSVSLAVNGKHDDNEENHEMEDVETPRTPAKSPVLAGAVANPFTVMSIDPRDTGGDLSLSERYDDVEVIGKGEFSIVFAASERSSRGIAPPARYAIKRTKAPFGGAKARARSVEELEILRALTSGNSASDDDGKEYVVNLVDGWELRGHFYIVTEFCENGNLDAFLSERGNVSRLDEWRVWKILVEISLVCLLQLLCCWSILLTC